jgi:integrase
MKELKIGKYSEGVRENYCNQKRNEIITNLRLGEEPPAASKLKKKEANLLSQVAAAYFAQRRENETTKSDKAIFEHYISPNFKDIDLIDSSSIEKFDKYLKTAKQKNNKNKTLSPKYQNDIKSLLGTINRYALKHNHTKNDFTMYLKFDSIDNDRERFLTLEEIEILYRYYKDDFETLLFCKLALTTGGRLNDLLNLKKKDINFSNKLAKLKNFKSDNTYTIFLKNNVVELLEKHVQNFKPNDHIFTSVSQTRLLKDLDDLFNEGIEKDDTKNRVVIHTLRHTFASHLAINGTPIYTISKLMDHKDIKMTIRYAKLAPDSGRNSIEDLMF